MKARKYTACKAVSHVYVNSQGQHFFEIIVSGSESPWENAKRREWFFIDFGFDDWSRAPKYVELMAVQAVYELVKSGNAKYYEKDRDGFERYENLRYHDQEGIDWIIRCCERRLELRKASGESEGQE